MSNYITIDGGTTNTRLCLVSDGSVKSCLKYKVGSGPATGSKEALIDAVNEGLSKLSEGTNIDAIIASGMITSEYGLHRVNHIVAPAGIKELNANLCTVKLDSCLGREITFIPGIRLAGEDVHEVDFMRGEETEIFGLYENSKSGVYVLPGSHLKIIQINEDGIIDHFESTLSGELISAISSGTILKASVEMCNTFNKDYLKQGYQYAASYGINAALFKVRVLSTSFELDKVDIYSFFLGCVLCADVSRIRNFANGKNVFIGGKQQLSSAISCLLDDTSNVTVFSDAKTEYASAFGAVKIYEYLS